MSGTRALKSICVFCGSNPGHNPAYLSSAQDLGRVIAEQNLKLVYGGASIGLMGAVADACLEAGGIVAGVMPQFLADKEIQHPSLSEEHIVNDMHERKALMEELSDGFICLPGGGGTLDELFEMFTWAQLNMHEKPIALLDVADFYTHLIAFIDHAIAEGFIAEAHRELIMVDADPQSIVDQFRKYRVPGGSKWL